MFAKITALSAVTLEAAQAHDLSQYNGQQIARTAESLSKLNTSTAPGVLVQILQEEAGGSIQLLLNEKGAAYLGSLGVKYDVVHQNVTALVEAEQLHMKKHKDDDFFSTFRTNDELLAFYSELESKHSDTLTFGPSGNGKSIEGRDIYLGKISKPGTRNGKPVYFVGATIHAREWLSPMTLAFDIQKLLVQLDSGDEEVNEILDEVDIHFIPVVNPDGYIYSHTTSRFWRKNRRNNGDGIFGVDLNRNWATYDWGSGRGISRNPSSDAYCGTGPFSEPESTFYGRYTNVLGDRLIAFTDIRTYGSVLLRPQFENRSKAPDDVRDTAAAKVFIDGIASVNGLKYGDITGGDFTRGGVTGSSAQYAYEDAGIQEDGKRPYGFALKLRGDNFVTPANNIVPSGEEIFTGMIKFLQHIMRSNNVARRGENFVTPANNSVPFGEGIFTRMIKYLQHIFKL